MARILAVSSYVASGHVGLAAIVPALQALGHDVAALPTILLSSHPGNIGFAGAPVEPKLFESLLDALVCSAATDPFDAVITGYMPTQRHVTATARVISEQLARPATAYICDPVIGDDPKGLYVDVEVAAALRDNLLPLADIITPNRFELSWLAGSTVENPAQAHQAALRLNISNVITTSVPTGSADIANVLVAGDQSCVCQVPLRRDVPHGTGDLFAGLLLGHALSGQERLSDAIRRATAGTRFVVEASLGSRELRLVGNIGAAASAMPSQSIPLAIDAGLTPSD